jgi:uncharacterized protein (TIGR02099 family)
MLLFVPPLPPFSGAATLWLRLRRLARWACWALLALGLMLAVAWGTLHLWIVPRIGEFRPALEQLARQTLGVPVRVGGIEARSTGWAPSFELRDIQLLDTEGRPALTLPRVVVAISVRSVLRLGLEQLVLDQPLLDVRHTASGQWLIAGLSLGSAHSDNSAVADWLFAQREVIVRGGTLRWVSERAQPSPAALPTALALADVDIVLRNGHRDHALRVDATPPAEWGERFVLMGQFHRPLLATHAGHFASWSGPAYAYFPHVDVSQLRQHVRLGVDVTSGQGSLRLWSDIQNGEWAGGAADMDLRAVQATLDPTLGPLGFAQLSGRLAGQSNALGWRVSTRDLAFVSDRGLSWPGGNVSVHLTHASAKQAEKGEIKGDRLDLQALHDVALRLPLPAHWHERLMQHHIEGRVSALRLAWQGPRQAPEKYEAHIKADGLRVQALSEDAEHLPGVDGARLELDMNQQSGRAQLHLDQGGQLAWAGLLEDKSLTLRELHADGRWQWQNGRLQVPQWKVQVASDDLEGEAHGQWQASPEGGPGVLDLQGRFPRVEAHRVYRYLPLSLPEEVRHYVRDSVVKGTASKVQVRIKGDLKDLPFSQPKQGEFHFAGRLRDVDMVYVPTRLQPTGSLPWPRIAGLSGDVVFDRLGMKLANASARLGEGKNGVQVSNLKAEIPNMAHDARVDVSADLRASTSQALVLIQQSPLNKLLQGALGKAEGTGTLQAKLKLAIPVLHVEDSKVQGSVMLAGSDLAIVPGLPVLEKIQGTLTFNESGFQLPNAQLRLLGGPARLEGGTRTANADAKEPLLLFKAQGQVSAEGLRQASGLRPLDLLAQHARGSTAYSASLGWRQGQPELSVRSTLEGLELNLPAPLGKTSQQAMPLVINSQVLAAERSLRDQVQIGLGSVASAVYVRDLGGTAPTVLRGSVNIGTQPTNAALLPDSGVSAKVVLDQFSVDAWQALWPAQAGEAMANGLSEWEGYLPNRLTVQAQTLTTDARTLHQVVAGITRERSTWRASVDARELSGQIEYTPPGASQSGRVYARLSRLNLPPSSIGDVESMLEAPPLSMPALDIEVADLELRGKKLGRVDIEAINTEPRALAASPTREWQLKKFNITVPEASFRATGRWVTALEAGRARKTDMNFKLDVSDAGALLTRLGTPGALRGGTGRMEGQIDWSGSPLALHYPSMNGHFALQMGRGQFLKADAGAAKLLGVLSLQALPRRLLLDFRDVFSEGFAFDAVQGDVRIAKGIATTRNLQIKGVNALVQMEGSADIAKETQQLHVLILPELDAGTASLVAGITVNPVVGLTSFLAQLLLKKPLAKASVQTFAIDGSWSEPRVTRIDNAAPTAVPSGSAASAP